VEEDTGTVNTEQYTVLLKTFLCSESHPHQQDLLWLQQGGATAVTVQISMQVHRTVFPSRLFSHFGDITWPAHSHDLAVPDYFLWSCVKSKVYETHPANIDDLKHQLWSVFKGSQGNATCYNIPS
jgi:hypothetical protein